MDFEDKIKAILEAVEDEEDIDVYDDLYKDEEDPEEFDRKKNIQKQLGIDDDEEDEDLSASVDWTGIPNPPTGRTLDDMKNARVMGPPLKVVDGNLALADNSLEYDKKIDGYKYPEVKRRISMDEYVALLNIAGDEDNEDAQVAKKEIDRYYPVDKDGKEIQMVDGKFQERPAEFQVRGARFQGGKITPTVWKNFPPEMQSSFIPVDEDGNKVNVEDEKLSHFERQRNDIDKEFLVGEDESHWYFDDVVRALKPYAMGIARGTNTPVYSQHEAFTDAISGIRQAWLTDLGRSPFHNHAYKNMLASVKDAANKARNITGEKKSIGGVRQWASAYKGAVSADAPIGGVEDGDATIAATLSKDIISEPEGLDKHNKMLSLIYGLAGLDEVGLTKSENFILLHSYGLDPKNPGQNSQYKDESGNVVEGPVPMSVIADKANISRARVSQIRKSAMQKLMRFMEENQIQSTEDALERFGLEESKQLINSLIESMIGIIELECEVMSETKRININTKINDISRNLTFIVNSDTNEIDSILDEAGDILIGKVDGSVIREAIMSSKIISGSKYFSEMASQILSMNCKPILGVINFNKKKNHKLSKSEFGSKGKPRDCHAAR